MRYNDGFGVISDAPTGSLQLRWWSFVLNRSQPVSSARAITLNPDRSVIPLKPRRSVRTELGAGVGSCL